MTIWAYNGSLGNRTSKLLPNWCIVSSSALAIANFTGSSLLQLISSHALWSASKFMCLRMGFYELIYDRAWSVEAAELGQLFGCLRVTKNKSYLDQEFPVECRKLEGKTLRLRATKKDF